MTYSEWIKDILGNGLICAQYTKKLDVAYSKKSIMDILLDTNGSTFLPEMLEKGKGLPYTTFLNEFGNYINGKYVASYHNERGNGYTSSIYCEFSDLKPLDIQTTLTIFLGCKTALSIQENDYVKIVADKNCDLRINCPSSSRCIVEYWDGANISLYGAKEKVELIKKN